MWNFGWSLRLPKTFSYGGGAPGESTGDKYDSNRPFFYIDEDGMAVIGLVQLGPIERPELGDPTLATDLAGEVIEAQKKADEDDKKSADKEPDDHSNTAKPVIDAKSNIGGSHIMIFDSLKPGAVFYNPRLGFNEIKDKDGGATMTAKPAIDTLPTFY